MGSCFEFRVGFELWLSFGELEFGLNFDKIGLRLCVKFKFKIRNICLELRLEQGKSERKK